MQAFVEQGQPFIPVHGAGRHHKGTEMSHHVTVDLPQPGACLLYIVRLNGIGQTDPALIPAFCYLPHQHIAVLFADLVKSVALGSDC